MIIADINNGTMINNIAAIFILLGILIYLTFLKKNEQFQDYLLIGAVSTDLLMAASIALNSMLAGSSIPDAARLLTGSYTFYLILYQFFFYVFGLYLLCQDGEEKKVREKWKLIAIPFVAEAVMILGNLFGHYLFYVNPAAIQIQEIKYFRLIYIVPIVMTGYTLYKLWPSIKALTITYAIMLAIRIYFDYALHNVSCTPLFLAVAIVYTYGCIWIRGILFQVGTIIALLFAVMGLFVGNFVTVSAFSSFLSTVSDAHSFEMYEVTEVMEHFKAMPWLMDYWKRNARRIKINPYAEYDKLYAVLSKDNVRRVTVEEVESLSPEMQYLFANQCYLRIAETYEAAMDDYSMNELFLVIPERSDRALVIFDSRRNEDGSYRLGEMLDMRELEAAWNNYEIASSRNYLNWTWLRFTEKDDFGFYSEFPYSEESEPARLCDMIKSGEVYAQMTFTETFRQQVALFFGALALIVLLVLYFSLVKPLLRMKESLNEYRQDKDAQKVVEGLSTIRARNEIGVFAEDFSDLAQEMDRYTKEVAELAGKQERVNTELRMASQIQEAMLPDAIPDRSDFDLYAMMDPAKAVGGDFYDFFLIDETHLALLIADVSDKGVPAALFMMSSRNLINYRAKQGGTPGEILSDINTQISSSGLTEMFVTVWMGILDLETGRMVCTNAGHEFPVLRGPDGVFRIYKDKHCLVVGAMEDVQYKDYVLELNPGDALFLYTDGAPEASNSAQEFYGLERLEKALNSAPQDTPEQIVKSVRADIEAFVEDAEQFDDLTMLCLVYKGPGTQQDKSDRTLAEEKEKPVG